ncbi:MAG TPA: HAD-IA family hydrolase, partial [Methylotenera sp.]|nr:HAD-IA family hydrolase [Methylotenera sp.]
MALVMYDLDGTLIDTASEIALAVNATLRQYKFNTVTEDQVKAWIGHGTVWLMQQAWPDKRDVDAHDTWNKVMENFIQHYKHVVGTASKPYPAVLETLTKLKEQGIKQAIVTNKEEPYTSKILAQHNMKDLFDLLISGNSLPYKKPDAAVIAYCLEALGETKESSLFVGDSEIDITTAKNAGVSCWVVPYGYNAGRDIAKA